MWAGQGGTNALLKLFSRGRGRSRGNPCPLQERGKESIEIAKIWLFENHIGDDGAAAAATLLHGGVLEVHLSHNQVTTKGESRFLEATKV